VKDFDTALEQASQRALASTAQLASEQPAIGLAAATSYDTVAVAPSQPVLPTETTPSADLPVSALEPTVYPGSSAPNGLDTPQSRTAAETPKSGQLLAPTAAVVSPIEPTMPVQRKARRLPRISAALLIGLVIVIIAAGVLGSLSLLAHFGVIGARSGPTTPTAVRGGTWIVESTHDPDSLIPNGGLANGPDIFMDQALYLPLFYGDAQGVVHPGAASDMPTVQNGGISPDATTWTFRLRPHLVWSDDQPYDARDVDYTWRLWKSPKFGANNTLGLNLITSTDVSADHLSITFHLKQPFVPFLTDLWVDGYSAPLPAHHFSAMAPETILKSPDNLNPRVTSGPFLMQDSQPSDHYTVVRNPSYYRAREGLPYLDQVLFRINANEDAFLKDLQAGSIDSTPFFSYSQVPAYQRLSAYRIVTPPTSAGFEGLFFNFHNTVLASHLEVRQAMAMAIDQQALINLAMHGFATPLCTDHGSFYHPGYESPVDAPCPEFNPAAANKLLSDNGWVKGPDGVRTKGGQRLEFEFSTRTNLDWRLDVEAILQRNFGAIGIKLDIQNYPSGTFIGSFLSGGKASPPTGAVAGRYDIAEIGDSFSYDPDDSSLLSCDQIPPNGGNIDFYCNPKLDALYKQELATADPGVRQQLFDQIHQIYLTDFPFITLFSQTIIAIVRKGTHNYQLSPFVGDSTVNIWEWWCDNGKC
jgi:peptide/nickel transport system substrate-binding protein